MKFFGTLVGVLASLALLPLALFARLRDGLLVALERRELRDATLDAASRLCAGIRAAVEMNASRGEACESATLAHLAELQIIVAGRRWGTDEWVVALRDEADALAEALHGHVGPGHLCARYEAAECVYRAAAVAAGWDSDGGDVRIAAALEALERLCRSNPDNRDGDLAAVAAAMGVWPHLVGRDGRFDVQVFTDAVRARVVEESPAVVWGLRLVPALVVAYLICVIYWRLADAGLCPRPGLWWPR